MCCSSGNEDALRYMDGLLGNCVLALMSLDRLARIHFGEDLESANSASVALQQYESPLLLRIAALERLTWVLLALTDAKPDRRAGDVSEAGQ